MLDQGDVASEEVRFQAEDGWELAGTVYRGAAPRVAVLISAGTGFPRRFYRHAAAYLAHRGAVVLTYDFRGIGESGAEDLAVSGIDYPDWGRLDMTAALGCLEQLAPGVPLTTLGHSIGGQFVGFTQNHHKVARHAFVAVGNGHWGVHKPRNVPLELFWWWGYGTYCLARYGFIPSGGLWGGEALPPDVFRTWRRWSARRSYLLPDLVSGRYPHHFDEPCSPISAWVMSDDPIATITACRDTLSHYSQAETHLQVRTPKHLGAGKIGHDGAFRKGHEVLWDELWDWLVDGLLPVETQHGQLPSGGASGSV
ncbi:alpha/beta hydrolase family protein [Shimia sagamensis]|uniref:Predicted alpha/beta hydrolase n=1 Tax=Shimia sagamensis TaxID=1566352 RepID=A0ABY1P4S9_9RHOB|nr:alpha/beta hydrolase [Shimia sagamensis]SMP26516.1 Predicted alpha/beta hydrolase [Shimia sagamensis]